MLLFLNYFGLFCDTFDIISTTSLPLTFQITQDSNIVKFDAGTELGCQLKTLESDVCNGPLMPGKSYRYLILNLVLLSLSLNICILRNKSSPALLNNMQAKIPAVQEPSRLRTCTLKLSNKHRFCKHESIELIVQGTRTQADLENCRFLYAGVY